MPGSPKQLQEKNEENRDSKIVAHRIFSWFFFFNVLLAPSLFLGITNALFGLHNETMWFCSFKHHDLA